MKTEEILSNMAKIRQNQCIFPCVSSDISTLGHRNFFKLLQSVSYIPI